MDWKSVCRVLPGLFGTGEESTGSWGWVDLKCVVGRAVKRMNPDADSIEGQFSIARVVKGTRKVPDETRIEKASSSCSKRVIIQSWSRF